LRSENVHKAIDEVRKIRNDGAGNKQDVMLGTCTTLVENSMFRQVQ